MSSPVIKPVIKLSKPKLTKRILTILPLSKQPKLYKLFMSIRETGKFKNDWFTYIEMIKINDKKYKDKKITRDDMRLIAVKYKKFKAKYLKYKTVKLNDSKDIKTPKPKKKKVKKKAPKAPKKISKKSKISKVINEPIEEKYILPDADKAPEEEKKEDDDELD